MTLLEIIDFLLHFLLGLIHGLANFVTHFVGFLFGDFLMHLVCLVGRILGVTLCLLRSTLCLINNSLVSHFLIANSFADTLLNLAHDLL